MAAFAASLAWAIWWPRQWSLFGLIAEAPIAPAGAMPLIEQHHSRSGDN
jgi:hypothetical protein